MLLDEKWLDYEAAIILMNIVSQRWGESSRVRWHICFQHFLFLQKFRFSSKFLLFLKVSFFFHCLNFRGWLLPCHLLHLLLPCPEPGLEISTNFTSYYISHFPFYSILSLNYFHHSNLSHFKFYNFKSILFLTHLTSYYKSLFIFCTSLCQLHKNFMWAPFQLKCVRFDLFYAMNR